MTLTDVGNDTITGSFESQFSQDTLTQGLRSRVLYDKSVVVIASAPRARRAYCVHRVCTGCSRVTRDNA